MLAPETIRYAVLLVILLAVLGFLVWQVVRDVLKPPPPKPVDSDSWLHRVAAVLALGVFLAVFIPTAAYCSAEGCYESQNDIWQLSFYASLPLFWAMPKLGRWFWGWFEPSHPGGAAVLRKVSAGFGIATAAITIVFFAFSLVLVTIHCAGRDWCAADAYPWMLPALAAIPAFFGAVHLFRTMRRPGR